MKIALLEKAEDGHDLVRIQNRFIGLLDRNLQPTSFNEYAAHDRIKAAKKARAKDFNRVGLHRALDAVMDSAAYHQSEAVRHSQALKGAGPSLTSSQRAHWQAMRLHEEAAKKPSTKNTRVANAASEQARTLEGRFA